MVDVPLAHLDHPFDYSVPPALDAAARPGVRVRVRFAGRLVSGFLVERTDVSSHEGALVPLAAVVSAEPALAPETLALARALADSFGGAVADVLRLAVPPRRASVEASEPLPPPPRPEPPEPAGWSAYSGGAALIEALLRGAAPRGVWTPLPVESWPDRIADAVRATLASGRGAVVVVPDGRDVARLDAALTATLPAGSHVALTADLGATERYRRWLALRRGEVRAVVGTRAAAFAPVTRPGLLVVWDDGDDLHEEPRAPYLHVRDVLVRRAHLTGAGLVVAGFARTAEAALLVASGWARDVSAPRLLVRRTAPRVLAIDDDVAVARDPAGTAARLPTVAVDLARSALADGAPVLVQVPRAGYLPAIACARCRQVARCPDCAGPLGATSASASPRCRWCDRAGTEWRCPGCSATALRALAVGAQRTAEELGRAFPGVAVRTSEGAGVLATVPGRPALVVATPGAEPVATGGYGAALLLDGWALLGRPDLRAAEEALRRWLNAAALVRPGGRIVVAASGSLRAVQALLRWHPAWHAERELAERTALGLPPAVRLAELTGAPGALAAGLAELDLPPGAAVLGPVPLSRAADGSVRQRLLLRVPREHGARLGAAVAALLRARSARKSPEPLHARLDPRDIG